MVSELLPRWLLGGSADPPAPLRLELWDDGFTPSGSGGRPGTIVRGLPRSNSGLFKVVDASVSARTADLLYKSAVRATVWGVYVPTHKLCLDGGEAAVELPNEETEGNAEAYRTALATRAVQEFLVSKATPKWISAGDWVATHGVAVWVIASDCNDETEYHLDYAEQVRFETNTIVPPIYGATLHVSPLRNPTDVRNTPSIGDENGKEADGQMLQLQGGAFHVNVSGLTHYAKYGYKTRKQGKLTTDELEAASEREPGWHRVGYQYRRGILCDGEFPHFSGRVRSLPPATGATPVKRVVVGFNMFPHAVGPFVAKFPEHSSAFNKYVKLAQTAAKQTKLLSTESKWSLESVRKNPKQAAFLKVLARKVKEKRLADAQVPKATTAS